MKEFSDTYKLLHEIVDYGKYSFELEKQREESLIQQAGRMLSAFSFSTVALYMLLPIVLADSVKLGSRCVFFWVGLISFFLLLSLVFAMAATWRRRHYTMHGVEGFYTYVQGKQKDFLENDYLFLNEWKDALSKMQVRLFQNNKRRANLVRISMILFFVSVALVFSAIINAYYIYKAMGVL